MANILLIEDDEPLRKVLAITLAKAGHTVVQAGDGNECLHKFHHAAPDLVITDIVMPGKEGIETIMALRKESPRLPIIAISGAANYSPMYLAMAAKLGAQRILSKPFTGADLLRAIGAVLPAPSAC